MTERIIKTWERLYTKLEVVAKMLEALSPNNAIYIVEDVYLDFGQDWMWTTIVRHGFKECQILSPRDCEEIMACETATDFAIVVNNIRNDKYFGDKYKVEEK